jgi:hypothetical protein
VGVMQEQSRIPGVAQHTIKNLKNFAGIRVLLFSDASIRILKTMAIRVNIPRKTNPDLN